MCFGTEASSFRTVWRSASLICNWLKSAIINGHRLRNSAAVRCNAFVWRKWRGAEKKLKVHVAARRDLGDVVAGASEWLLPPDLATEFLVTLVGVSDIGLFYQRFATSTFALSADDLHPKVPEAAGWNLVRAQRQLCYELFFAYLTQVSLQL